VNINGPSWRNDVLSVFRAAPSNQSTL